MYIGFHVKYQLFLSDFNETWCFQTDCRKSLISDFMKIRSGPSCFTRTDWRTHTTNLIVAFSNFANASKKCGYKLSSCDCWCCLGKQSLFVVSIIVRRTLALSVGTMQNYQMFINVIKSPFQVLWMSIHAKDWCWLQCLPTCWLIGAPELLQEGGGCAAAICCNTSCSSTSSSAVGSMLRARCSLLPLRTALSKSDDTSLPFVFLHRDRRSRNCLFVLSLSKTSILPWVRYSWRVTTPRTGRFGYRCLFSCRDKSFFLSTVSRVFRGPFQPLIE